ncbi:hypothetical protein ACOSP7_002630 [Xanthoceras sorbifolium]
MRIPIRNLSGFILIVVVSFLLSACDAQQISKKTHVIINNLIGAGIDLKLHCQSKDDDLGEHVIPYQGNYTINFRPNFWGTTLYTCSFQWQNEFRRFDIYQYARDYPFCHTCPWFIRAQGLCMLDKKEKGYDICYKW